jgi:hypothetical protein
MCNTNKLLCFIQGVHDYIIQESTLFPLQNDSLKELLNIDLSWEMDDWKGNNEDADVHDSSQISVDMHQIKQQLNDSIQHLSMEFSSCNDSALEGSHNSCSVLDTTSTAGLYWFLLSHIGLKYSKTLIKTFQS